MGQIVIKDNRHIVHEVVRDFSPGLINFINNLDDDRQALLRFCLLHQVLDPCQTTENRTSTSPCYMRKQAMVNRVVLGGVRRVVSDADFDADLIGQVLQVGLEEIMPSVVATASIAQDQE